MSPVRIVHVETDAATVDASELDTPVITLDPGAVLWSAMRAV
jgi:hypothetical protein